MQADGDISLIRSSFGDRIRHLRIARGLSQYKLSDMTGVNRSYLSQVEQGKRNISFDNMLRISHGLNIPLSVLVSEVDTIWFSVEYDEEA